MAGTILTGSLSLDLIETPIQKFFGDSYEDWPTIYDKIFKVEMTDERFKRDVLLRGMSIAQPKPEGAQPVKDDMGQAWYQTYEAAPYGLFASVSHEAIEDTHDVKPLLDAAKFLKKAAMLRMEIVGNSVLDSAFTSGVNGGDGVRLCYGSHPTFSGVTYRNTPATSADMSEAILEQAVIDIHSLIDERNNPAYADPDGRIMISKENEFETHRVLNSVLRYQTADNDPNAIKDLGYFKEIIKTPYFTTSTQQFFIPTTLSENGLKMLIRKEPVVDIDDVFISKVVQLSVYLRLTASWTDPRGLYGVPGV